MKVADIVAILGSIDIIMETGRSLIPTRFLTFRAGHRPVLFAVASPCTPELAMEMN